MEIQSDFSTEKRKKKKNFSIANNPILSTSKMKKMIKKMTKNPQSFAPALHYQFHFKPEATSNSLPNSFMFPKKKKKKKKKKKI